MRLITQQKLGICNLPNICRILCLYTNRVRLLQTYATKVCESNIMNAGFSQAFTYALSKIGKSGICAQGRTVGYTPHLSRKRRIFVPTNWLWKVDLLRSFAFLVWLQARHHFISRKWLRSTSPLVSLMVDQVVSLRSLYLQKKKSSLEPIGSSSVTYVG